MAATNNAIKRIYNRRDTASNWTTKNPILGSGEFGYETDTKKIKMGDGTTTWNSLPYFIIKADSGINANNLLTLDSAANTIKDSGVSKTSIIPTDHSSTATTYGIASSSKYGHAMASSVTPLAAGTASAGTDNGKYAREGHIHTEQTSVTGNAGTATKLATARTLSVSGDASGSTSFDGSANKDIAVVLSSVATAGTTGETANKTLDYGGTFVVPQVTIDAKGRSTAITGRTMTMPGSPSAAQVGAAPSAAGVPVGGSAGQLLRKASATDYDGAWWTPAAVASSGAYADLTGRPTIPTVNNTLTSASSSEALSALQGKTLKDTLDGKAPTSHASNATTYGVGTTANYGHVKLSSATPAALGTASAGTADGVVANANHVHAKPSLADLGAAAASHNHDAANINAGTLAADRLPTVPVAKGGTGATTAAAALTALGVPALSSTTPAALGTAAVGTSTTSARADHVHAYPTPANIGAAPANATLTDGTAANTLPATTASALTALIQTARNCLKWLVARFDGSGNANAALKLATARSLKTNLASTAAVTFDGSAAQDSIPVTGTLPIANGGTGNTTGNAASATKLATSRDIKLIGEATGNASFNGTLNAEITVTTSSPITTITSSTTVYVGGAGNKFYLCNNSSDITITLSGILTGDGSWTASEYAFFRAGAGKVTFAQAGGISLTLFGGKKTIGSQGGCVAAKVIAGNASSLTVTLFGDLA